MQEKIVETKICVKCNLNFEITNKDLEFYNKISPKIEGKVFQIPSPSLCPSCREQSRLLWRNERKLYRRKCDATGKQIISVYSPDKPYKVYNQKDWWSDKWNALDYSQDFDFTKGFFSQFKELFDKVPQQDLIGANNENSPFCHLVADNKNCYLISESSNNEDCLYGYWLQKSNDCVDCSFIHGCEKCFESINCINCFNSSYLNHCEECKDSFLLRDCIGCTNCFACTNLINKQYYIFNESYSKEVYFEKIKEAKNNKSVFDKFLKLNIKSIKKYCDITNGVFSSGNQITNSKNCNNAFHAHDAEDCKYVEHVWREAKNCMDVNTAGRTAENIYYSLNCGINVFNLKFCNQCWESSDMIYCSNCNGSKNCFGSVGLVNKEYCILNKQYTKQEYNKLVPKIIEHMMKTGEWGEFFPSSISPFGYNETVAQEYYPLPHPNPLLGEEREQDQKGLFQFTPFTFKGENIEVKFNRSDYEQAFPKVEKIIPANKLPDNIALILDDILNRAIECEITKKPFRIIFQELEFYRKQDLSIPKLHPDIRHSNRLKIGNPRKLYDRKCDKCGIEIKTIYSPDRPEIVYCEECYNKEFY